MRFLTIPEDPDLHAYMQRMSLREPGLLARLRAETATLPSGHMQIAPEQGQFMGFLAALTGARRALELGTFTGYSSLCVALALPPDGRLVCLDHNREWTDIARRYWSEAGVAEKIDLRLGEALDSLDALIAEGQAETFDFAFIDADKANYETYFERVLALLRPGGLVTVDNVLWGGAVADAADTTADTEFIRAFNARRLDDERIDLSLVPIGDGLTLARKRPAAVAGP